MNDFEAMSEMSKQNKDIRMSGTILNVDSGKKTSSVRMQVDEETAQLIARGIFSNNPTHYVALYIVNKNEFNQMKQEFDEAIKKI